MTLIEKIIYEAAHSKPDCFLYIVYAGNTSEVVDVNELVLRNYKPESLDLIDALHLGEAVNISTPDYPVTITRIR